MRVRTHEPGERELLVTFTFEPDDVRLEHGLIGVVVHLRDFPTAGEPGSPALPTCTVRVALPPRTRLIGIDAQSAETTMISTAVVPVAPLQLARPGAIQLANPVLYEEAMRRPVARVVDTTVEGLSPVAAIDLNPVRLTPDARLELSTRIDVIVRYERERRQIGRTSGVHRKAVANFPVNGG